MAVYAALFSLKSKIRSFLKHYDACFDPSSLELTHYLDNEVMLFQEFVERLNISSRKMMNASLARITESITKFCDLLSEHLSDKRFKVPGQKTQFLLSLGLSEGEENQDQVNQMLLALQEEEEQEEEEEESQLLLPVDLSESEDSNGDESNQMSHLIDLGDIKRDIHSFIEALKKVKEEHSEKEDESSSSIDFRRNESTMIGLSDLQAKLKESIINSTWGRDVQFLSIGGMAGIGKTTLAKKIYQDLDFVEWFDCRSWVVVGREWQLHKIIRCILAQVNPNYADEMGEYEDDERERESEYLKECLEGNRYLNLIVLDDVWDVQVWYDLNKLLTTTMQNVAGCRVLLTSRMQEVIDRAGAGLGLNSLDMRLLNKEESWDLLREKLFAAESCSFQLERAGRKIAEKCDGLPLTIITVADLLSKEEKTVEYWNEVATREKHQVFVATYDVVTKVLFPSCWGIEYTRLSVDLNRSLCRPGHVEAK